MRKPRILEAITWYWIVTAINRHEPLFLDRAAVDLFNQVLREAGKRFAIEVRHLVIQADRVSFYIKPADGFMLPIVMQWIKQTFACRYNVYDGRTGHIWGDRYESVIVEGPPKDAEEYVFAAVVCEAASRKVRRAEKAGSGGAPVRGGSAVSPATNAEGRPRTGETARNASGPPDLPRRDALSHGSAALNRPTDGENGSFRHSQNFSQTWLRERCVRRVAP
jgi:REP element-mobilizing transposase RayT